MNKKLLVVEDNLTITTSIINFFEKNKKCIEVIKAPNEIQETLELIKITHPFFLIIDLDTSNIKGIKILNMIDNDIDCKINIIIFSGKKKLINHLNLMKYKKVVKILIKPFNISLIYNVIENTKLENDDCIDYTIDNILHKFNFNFSSKFYRYLQLVIKKSLYKPFILKDLYKEIATEENIPVNQIKWGIEKLILSMNRYTQKNVMSQYFFHNSSPSPKNFINEISNIVKKYLLNRSHFNQL